MIKPPKEKTGEKGRDIQMPQLNKRWLGAILVVAVAAATAVAAAGAAPARHAGGTLTFCSDITYPPEEFYVGTKPAGSDIDIGTAVAKRLGKTAKFTNTGFDGIIAALQAKKCDAIISGMNDTPARAKQVSFVDYISVGQSLMVKKGNPSHITNLASLAGKTVSVEVGTTNKDFLDQESKTLKKQGKKSIKVQSFPKDTDAAAALKTGRVDAYFGDSPVVAYYISKDSSFAFAGAPVNPIPVGIAVRKDDTATRVGIAKAIKGMYADGTMKRILARWQMSAFALKKK
jgi:polar amino acid transport system substrate-binding protein